MVTITPALLYVQLDPNSQVTVFNLTDPTPDAWTTEPTAWAPAVFRWGTDDSLNTPEPATLTVTLTLPPESPIPYYGAPVVLYYKLDGWSENPDQLRPLFVGYVDGAERTPWRDGTVRVDISASDALARLRRIKLSDEPWPDEWAGDRWARIRALLTDRVPLADVAVESIWLAGRDVDNFTALDALRRATVHSDDVLWAAPLSGVTLERPEDYSTRLVIPVTAAEPLYLSPPTVTRTLPASALVNGPRILTTGSVVTHAALSYHERGVNDQSETVTEDRSVTAENRSAALDYGETRWNASSDALYDPDAIPVRPDPRGTLQQRLDRIIAARSREYWALPEMELLLDHWPEFVSGIAIREVLGKTTSLINITHGRPADLDAFYRVIGGELALHPDPQQVRLTYRLEPAAFAGVAGLTAADLGGLPEVTFERGTQITAAELATVSQNPITDEEL